MGNGDVVFNDDRAVSSDGTLGTETNITAKFQKGLRLAGANDHIDAAAERAFPPDGTG
ncbi:unknown [Akkermansia muciniphila CAG:154]|nr:unknown [Akkermansia muciniphila CAG:154]